MAQDKLLAEWFWTDRWMGSSGFLLPMLARGVYREMLTQAWRRGAKLPHDHNQIKRAIGASPEEWAEAWPLISKYWREDDRGNLVNDTQLAVYAEAQSMVDRNVHRAQNAAQARWKQRKSTSSRNAQASTHAQPEQCPPSPSPSPSPSQTPILNLKNKLTSRDSASQGGVGGIRQAAPAAPLARNISLITKLCHEVLGRHNGHRSSSGPDLLDEIKKLCAVRHIGYNSDVVRRALDSAEVQRKAKHA